MRTRELPRQDGAAMVVGGPTTVLDLGGLRIVSDPTFDGPGLPTVYISGDNASIGTVAEIAGRVPNIDAAVLHAGAARVQGKFRDRALSLDSIRAAAAAAVLGSAAVIPAHYDGWAHFTEGSRDLLRAFDDAGLGAHLRLRDHGTWVPLEP